MSQNPVYKYQSNIDYLGDFPGADVEANRIETNIAGADARIDIANRAARELGLIGVKDSADTRIDPATETTLSALAAALASNGNDRIRTTAVLNDGPVYVEGDDDDGNTLKANAETLSQAITDPNGLVTYLARALQSQGSVDQVRMDLQNDNVGLATETTVSSIDTGVTNLAGALASNATDTVEVQERSAEAIESGTAIASGGSNTNTLSAVAAERVSGIITRASTQYDVELRWQDGNGNTIQTETVASSVAGGTQTTFDVPARSETCVLAVVDSGSASGAVDLTAHMR